MSNGPNRMADEFAKMMNDAAGVAQGFKREVDGMIRAQAEKYLAGKAVDESSLDEAGKIAAEESKVRDSIRGVAWYRREMVGVLVKRMGMKAFERAA